GKEGSGGFGLVTLVYVVPIIAVELLGFISLSKSEESILSEDRNTPWNEEEGIKELYLSVRAILPLVVFLLLLVKVVLREKLPSISFYSILCISAPVAAEPQL